MKSSRAKKWRNAALTGFAAGVTGASAYLLSGGVYFLFVPRWAQIVFYPGFFMGFWAYEHLQAGEFCAKVVGVLSVGLAYAVAAVLLRLGRDFILRKMNHEKRGHPENP